jgi:transcriptional regulator with XRE-family HTH domain
MASKTALQTPDGKITLSPAKLKTLRRACGLSQESLAQRCFEKRLSISIASIKRAETGKPVLYRTARHMAQLYQVDLASLMPAPIPPSQLHGIRLNRMLGLTIPDACNADALLVLLGYEIRRWGGSMELVE